MTRRTLKLGTRKSELALAQSGMMARALEAAHPGLTVELVPIVTRGDQYQGPLAPLGGKGLFTAELEAGLLAGTLDLAVHSLKDLPVELPAGLTVAAFPERADARDVLVSEVGENLSALPDGGVVLTGSLRRQALVHLLAPHLRVEGLRGNVGTRLGRWREKDAAGVILAGAGLTRLGLTEVPAHPLDPEIFVPAPGQGILAIEVREGSEAEELCRALDHKPTARAAQAERYLVTEFGGDCTLPLAAWARHEDGGSTMRLIGLVATPDGTRIARGEAVGEDPEDLGPACAKALRRSGVEEVLAILRKTAEPG